MNIVVAVGYSFDKVIELGWCKDNQEIVANEYNHFITYQLTLPNLSADNLMKSADLSYCYIVEHLFDDNSDSLVTFVMEWVPRIHRLEETQSFVLLPVCLAKFIVCLPVQ